MRRIFRLGALFVATGIVSVQAAHAEDLIPGGEEKFKVTFGAVLAQIDSSIGVNGACLLYTSDAADE